MFTFIHTECINKLSKLLNNLKLFILCYFQFVLFFLSVYFLSQYFFFFSFLEILFFFLIAYAVYMDLFGCFSSVLLGSSTVIGQFFFFFFYCRVDVDFLFTLTDLKNSRPLLINF